jgi:hypothetical protein
MLASDLLLRKRRLVLGINTKFDPMTTPSNKQQIRRKRPPTTPLPKSL